MILLIGSTGLIGQEVRKLLEAKGLSYIAPSREEVNLEHDNADIMHKKFWDFFEDKPLKWIINCGAYTNVDKAEDERTLAYEINSEGVSRLNALANACDAKLIHLSTDYVFSGSKKSPYIETDSCQPLGWYGTTKLVGEFVCHAYPNRRSFVIRTSWVFGEGKNTFVDMIVKMAKEKSEIFAPIDRISSPTWSLSVAMFICSLIECDANKYGVYHFSGIGEMTRCDYAREIVRIGTELGIITNKQLRVISCGSEQFKERARRPYYSYLDSSKVISDLNYSIPTSKQMLEEFMVDMFKKDRWR